MLRRALTLVVLYLGILAVSPTATRSVAAQPARIDDAATDRKSDAQDSKRDALTLKRMFPKKSLFGPRVTRAEFSRDGRFCAFFYRPWAERRHGSDLYLMDTKTRRVSRITCVARMAEFQSDSRKVRDDRAKKAKAAGIKPPGNW